MPGGSGFLRPFQWQPVPGCEETLIYPFIRKVDTESSNSYLIRTPDADILIDPGGLPEQAKQIASLVLEPADPRLRPLIVCLTHAHVDHFAAIHAAPVLSDPRTAILVVQEDGAEAIESGDRRLTQADILQRTLAPLRVDLSLFAARRDQLTRMTFPNGAAVALVRGPPDCGLPHEQIVVGARTILGVYHTPGHSPDSICLRVGSLLFTGDLLFATTPGIAGIAGWDQEALIRSLGGLRALLSRDRVEALCPGHGNLIPADEVDRLIDAADRDVHLLTGIAEIDRDRASQTAAFAETCMEQVSELFTVMTGRLYYVSFVIDELGEPETAAALNGLIRGDVVDDLLAAFDAFNREYRSGRYVPINLALKGGQVIGKLQRSFQQEELGQIIDMSLVRRAVRLLHDYVTVLRGFPLAREIAVHDLRDLLETAIAAHSTAPTSDEEMLASVEDETSFGRLLLARIGMPPLLGDVAVELDAGSEPVAVLVDRDRFLDLVAYVLEELIGCGAHAVAVRVGRDGGPTTVSLSGTGFAGVVPRRFLFELCEQAGGLLGFDDSSGRPCYTIRIAPAI